MFACCLIWLVWLPCPWSIRCLGAVHSLTTLQDLATTPLYCEPKDFSSTSSTISNNVADPEYAVPDVAMANGQLSTHHSSTYSTGGHLTNNLNIFGNGLTRIFMGTGKNNQDSKAPVPSLVNTIGHNVTSNVAYSTQKFHYLSDSAKNSTINAANYVVNKPSPVVSANKYNSALSRQQYYASSDLVSKSPKAQKNNLSISSASTVSSSLGSGTMAYK